MSFARFASNGAQSSRPRSPITATTNPPNSPLFKHTTLDQGSRKLHPAADADNLQAAVPGLASREITSHQPILPPTKIPMNRASAGAVLPQNHTPITLGLQAEPFCLQQLIATKSAFLPQSRKRRVPGHFRPTSGGTLPNRMPALARSQLVKS